MPSLIEEIQRGAIDKNIPIDTLLRQAKLAASKLNLEELETWVHSELEGYTDDVPKYRELLGAPKAWNPYHGWVPIYMDEPSHMAAISTARTAQAIGTIVDMLAERKAAFFHFPLPFEIIQALNKGAAFQSPQMVIEVSRVHLVGIVDRVRDLILDWSIKMEKAGIVGNGLSFSDKEKAIAKENATMSINIGSIGSLTGSIGNENTIGNIAGRDIDISRSKQLLEDVARHADELVKNGADRQQLSDATKALEAEHSKPEPDQAAIKSQWKILDTVIKGGVGAIVSSGVKAAIEHLLRGGS